MDDPRGIVKVLDSAQKLEEVVASEALAEAPLLVPDLDKGKQVALLNQLKHDKEHLGVLPVRPHHPFSLAVILDEFDDVGVVHGLNQVDLVLEDLLEGGEVDALDFVALYDLNRVEPIVLQALCQLHPTH